MPQHDKSQLMDLQRRLRIDVTFDDGGGNVYFLIANIKQRKVIYYKFDHTFESFAEAIILAAAEIGEGIK
jgi:hypothetical protein